ncbi:MAG TPA: MFS transporter [Candidatus Acidoferrum sp.]|jgi:maltose/moltooligosaccharide transporter|nr:MFS transporter [Candidatus Acidoferrum sp.]
MQKPRLSFWQIWNMSFGFMGIQFGWGLQLANMSAIYAKLGADPSKIPILWLAGPITGLLVQPIIGSMSDRTWCWLGRRRPYFTTGAILSSVALFFMPDAPALWAAATMLWVLDASINISMEPFRAFVADKLSDEQRTVGFVMQSFFIGIGAAVANALPALLGQFGVTGNASNGVPLAVLYAFKLGAGVFLLAVIWTVLVSREYPPEDVEAFQKRKREHLGFQVQPIFLLIGATAGALLGATRGALVDHHLTLWHVLAGGAIGAAIGAVLSGPEVSSAIREMPATMKQLALVQFFTWLGLFCMWMFFGLATAQQIFGAVDPKSPAFDQGTIFGGDTFKWYSIVCFFVAFALPQVAKVTSRRAVHALALLAGGLSLLSTGLIHDRILWQCTMLGVGIAWASILAMPYAMLSSALPAHRMGVYMGIFNFFIVIPEILASIALEPVVKDLFGNSPVKVVMLGGASMLVAAGLTMRVKDSTATISPAPSGGEEARLAVEKAA